MSDAATIEETVAHLIRTVDDLSDMVARQDRELARMRAQLDLLLRREAERAAEAPGAVVVGDERPPHW
jgi:SlyX protein